jgi:hypothetical protein
MASGTDNSDPTGFLLLVAAGLIAAVGAGFWLNPIGAPPSNQPTFKAVEGGGPAEVICRHCQGQGKAQCYTCGGKGRAIYIGVVGGGEDWCRTCGGAKIATCIACKGSGKEVVERPRVLHVRGKKDR